MANKQAAHSLIEKEKRAQTAAYLAQIGAKEYEDAKESKNDGLTDVLLRQLKPSMRKKLAQRLIDIALDGSERTSLEALREIWDRVEGKSRVSVVQSRAEDDPLMKILSEVMANEPKLIASGTKATIVEAEVRELLPNE